MQIIQIALPIDIMTLLTANVKYKNTSQYLEQRLSVNLSVFTPNIANCLRKHVLLIRRYGVFFSFVVLVSKKFL